MYHECPCGCKRGKRCCLHPPAKTYTLVSLDKALHKHSLNLHGAGRVTPSCVSLGIFIDRKKPPISRGLFSDTNRSSRFVGYSIPRSTVGQLFGLGSHFRKVCRRCDCHYCLPLDWLPRPLRLNNTQSLLPQYDLGNPS